MSIYTISLALYTTIYMSKFVVKTELETMMDVIKIVNKSKHETPKRATEGSSGLDLRANIKGTITMAPQTTELINTGIYLDMPVGYEAQVRPRSGVSLKTGLRIANSPGTIDADYRGEIKIIVYNQGITSLTIKDGDKIAQLVITKLPTYRIKEVKYEELSKTTRGAGGFGSTD